MKSQYFQVFIRVLPIILAAVLVYLIWFYRGTEFLEESVTKVNTVASVMQGKAAPDFRITKALSWKGVELNLQSLKGKPVLLHFWATWCGPCVQELPELIELAKKRGSDMNFVAIAVDKDWQTISSFLGRYPALKDLPNVVTLALDPGGELPALYGTSGLPDTYLLRTDLTLETRLVGPQPWLSREMQPLLDSLAKQNR